MFTSTSKLYQYSEAYRPFTYPWAVELAVDHEGIHWIEKEVTLEDDIAEWKRDKLSEHEKNFVTQILRMFTQADVNVGQYYYENFLPIFKNNEIRNMLGSFAAREAIHQRAYALVTDTLGLPESEYVQFRKYKAMADKSNYMLEADPRTVSGMGLALAKSVFNEGVSLFASFAMLLNFQRFGRMKGMGKVVEWSIKDESLHVQGIAQLFRTHCHDHPRIVNDAFKKQIYDMARRIVELEDVFIDLAFEMGPVRGIEKEEIKQYIRHIADRRLLQLGLKPNFGVKTNPLDWLNYILNAADHTNFFEGRVTSYDVAGLVGSWDYDSLFSSAPEPPVAHWKIYSTPTCQYCKRAKSLLESRGISFEEVDISVDEQARSYIKDELGLKTVPQIFVDGVRIGGYDNLVVHFNGQSE